MPWRIIGCKNNKSCLKIQYKRLKSFALCTLSIYKKTPTVYMNRWACGVKNECVSYYSSENGLRLPPNGIDNPMKALTVFELSPKYM